MINTEKALILASILSGYNVLNYSVWVFEEG